MASTIWINSILTTNGLAPLCYKCIMCAIAQLYECDSWWLTSRVFGKFNWYENKYIKMNKYNFIYIINNINIYIYHLLSKWWTFNFIKSIGNQGLAPGFFSLFIFYWKLGHYLRWSLWIYNISRFIGAKTFSSGNIYCITRHVVERGSSLSGY